MASITQIPTFVQDIKQALSNELGGKFGSALKSKHIYYSNFAYITSSTFDEGNRKKIEASFNKISEISKLFLDKIVNVNEMKNILDEIHELSTNENERVRSIQEIGNNWKVSKLNIIKNLYIAMEKIDEAFKNISQEDLLKYNDEKPKEVKEVKEVKDNGQLQQIKEPEANNTQWNCKKNIALGIFAIIAILMGLYYNMISE